MQPRSPLAEHMRRADRTLVGTFLYMPEPDIVRVLGEVPLDFVIIDLEHGAYGLEGCIALLRAVAATRLYSVVRVPDAAPELIGKVLDFDADAVLVPHVSSAEDAQVAVAAARFPPRGQRGAYPNAVASRFGLDPRDPAAARDDTASVWVLVEGREGIANIGDIVAVPGIDALFVGPVDLSHSLGVPWQIDHPRVVEQVRGIRATAAAADVAVAVYAAQPSVLAAYGSGFNAVACSVDVAMLGRAYRQLVEDLRHV